MSQKRQGASHTVEYRTPVNHDTASAPSHPFSSQSAAAGSRASAKSPPTSSKSSGLKQNTNLISRMKRSFSSNGIRIAGPVQPISSISFTSSTKSLDVPSSLATVPSRSLQNSAQPSSTAPTTTAMARSAARSTSPSSSLDVPDQASLAETMVGSGTSTPMLRWTDSESTLASSTHTNPGARYTKPAMTRRSSFDIQAGLARSTSSIRTTSPQTPNRYDGRSSRSPQSDYGRESRSAMKRDVPVAPAPAMYWSKAPTMGHSPRPIRAHATVVYEGVMYVFGGTDNRGGFGSLYTLDLDTFMWSKPKTYGTPPPPCRAHSAVVCEEDAKVYVFGGGDGPNYYDHLYIFDIEKMYWTRPETTGLSPSPRRAHVSVIWNDNLYIVGGGDGVKALNDVYTLDMKTKIWTLVETSGNKPESRGYHSGTLVGSKIVIYGGSDGQTCFGDVYLLDLETNRWDTVSLHITIPRLSHAAVSVGSYLFVTGGHNGLHYCNELLLLNFVTMVWETRKVYGQGPSPRGYHTMVLYDSRLFLFGGYDGKHFFDDVYVLDLSSHAYLPQVTNFSIELS